MAYKRRQTAFICAVVVSACGAPTEPLPSPDVDAGTPCSSCVIEPQRVCVPDFASPDTAPCFLRRIDEVEQRYLDHADCLAQCGDASGAELSRCLAPVMLNRDRCFYDQAVDAWGCIEDGGQVDDCRQAACISRPT